MARWLVKTEPEEYSFQDLQEAGRDVWDGVRNALALKHMRAMNVGDEVLVYHTGKERAIVGVARVVREAYPDPEAGDERWIVVDLEAVRPLARPLPLPEIKEDPAFAQWELVRISRLSVMPVPDPLWERIMAMASG